VKNLDVEYRQELSGLRLSSEEFFSRKKFRLID
jgi:hypothetical protein